MRIIGGEWGGRRIQPPANMPYTRPTTDIAKEGLFNILQNMVDFEGLEALDLFGGTGAISYELASRGAASCLIIEMDVKMHQFINKNLAMLGASQAKVLRMEVFKYLETAQQSFDFIFAGPPYALGTIDELPRLIMQRKLLKPQGIFVLEHTPRNFYEKFDGYLKHRNYGSTIFSFFSPSALATP